MKFLLAFLLVLYFSTQLFAQPGNAQITQLNQEIANYEQQIMSLEKEISKNIANGNTSANARLRQEIERYDQLIMDNVEQINKLRNPPKPKPNPKPQPTPQPNNASAATNKNEKIIMQLQEEIRQAGEIIGELEEENLELRKELQKKLQQQGGTAEIERLEKKIERLEEKEQVLKDQLRAAKQNSGSVNRVGQLAVGQYHFLRQSRNVAQTNFLLSYSYHFNQQLDIRPGDELIQSASAVGIFMQAQQLALTGHRFSMGWEFLANRKVIGAGLGLLLDGAYYEDQGNLSQYGGLRLQGEISILPIRLGILLSGHLGYTWGELQNVQVLLNDGQTSNRVEFGSLLWGYDVKARIYLSRFLALSLSAGIDSALSRNLEETSYSTLDSRYGIGIDLLIPLTPRHKRVIYY